MTDVEFVRLHGRRVDFDREELGYAQAKGGHTLAVHDVPGVTFIRPEWHEQALCRGTMSDGRCNWFSDNPAERARARRICQRCPVRRPCAAAGVGQLGVWGEA